MYMWLAILLTAVMLGLFAVAFIIEFRNDGGDPIEVWSAVADEHGLEFKHGHRTGDLRLEGSYRGEHIEVYLRSRSRRHSQEYFTHYDIELGPRVPSDLVVKPQSVPDRLDQAVETHDVDLNPTSVGADLEIRAGDPETAAAFLDRRETTSALEKIVEFCAQPVAAHTPGEVTWLERVGSLRPDFILDHRQLMLTHDHIVDRAEILEAHLDLLVEFKRALNAGGDDGAVAETTTSTQNDGDAETYVSEW